MIVNHSSKRHNDESSEKLSQERNFLPLIPSQIKINFISSSRLDLTLMHI